jgi:ribose/xylose/arabinose/galactoside ABC-type transport system permease subunit
VKEQILKLNPFNKLDIKIEKSLLGLILLFVALAWITQGDFLDPRNFTNLTRQISINALLAVGMTWVILTGGIDLSVGSVVALTGIAVGMLQVKMGWNAHAGLGAIGSLGISILLGLACGAFNGFFISVLKIPPFVITLGMMVIARGMALILSNGQSLAPMSKDFKWMAKGFITQEFLYMFITVVCFSWLYRIVKNFSKYSTKFLPQAVLESICLAFPIYCFVLDRGIPLPVMILFAVAVLSMLVLYKTPLGQYTYAIGCNEEASELSGLPTVKTKMKVYMFMGALAGLCGALLSARLNSSTPTEGQLMELDAIAAVVIGGTSLTGGIGRIGGSLLGALFIGTLNNGMDLLEINSNFQMVIKGLIIITAVGLDRKKK